MAEKIAFITGGNRGIGYHTAQQLGSQPGIKVVIGSRDLAQGQKTVAKLREAGADVDVLQFDITKTADYQAAYDYFDSNYGRLDILINNAGINIRKLCIDYTLAEWNSVLTTNLTSVF